MDKAPSTDAASKEGAVSAAKDDTSDKYAWQSLLHIRLSRDTEPHRSTVKALLDDIAPDAPADLTAVVEESDNEPAKVQDAWASSSLSAETDASFANDGNLDTAWMSAPSEDFRDETLTFDLGALTAIDRVRIAAVFPDSMVDNFEIWAGPDLSDLAFVREMTELGKSVSTADSGAVKSVVTLGFVPVEARFVQLVLFDPEPSSQDRGSYAVSISEVEVLSRAASENTVRLSFVAPGDNHMVGTVDHYEVYQGLAPFDEASLNTAALLAERPTPVAAGLPQSMEVPRLALNTDYYFAVRAVDEANNRGPLSETVDVKTLKQRPAPVENLTVQEIGETAAVLSFSTPSAQEGAPSATHIEIRRAMFPLFEENFSLGEIAGAVVGPFAPDETRTIDVTDLTPDSTFYFAAAAVDAEGTASYVSENVKVETASSSAVSSGCGDGTCDDGETLETCKEDCNLTLSIIVEASLASSLESSFAQYRNDIAEDRQKAEVVVWNGGSAEDLRALISDRRALRAVKGVWLIGDLPAAWYEQAAFDTHEEFPIDLYFMDLDATWGDADADGIFDSRSDLSLDLFVSRIIGTSDELVSYFEKAHRYRENGSITDVSAYIFKDDDWQTFHAGSAWGLDAIYASVEKCETSDCTTRQQYVDRLSSGSAEFVYQWIHAAPSYLAVTGQGSGHITADQIAAGDFNGAFYNLFDCSAARFTQTNVAMTYLTKTDSALAVIGSTKTGGIYTPTQFHGALASGGTWGDAYVNWYNKNGKNNDEWYLGIVIQGDPLLTLVAPSDLTAPIAAYRMQELSSEESYTAGEVDSLARTMGRLAETVSLRTFKDYQNEHPDFFSTKHRSL